MTEIKDIGNLDWRIGIVDKAGRPTQAFQRLWASQRANNSQIGAITLGMGVPSNTPAPDDGAQYVDISQTPFVVYIGYNKTYHQAGVVVFTDLEDAPHTYSGAGLSLVRVKNTTDGLEFEAVSGVLDSLGSPATGQLLQRGGSTWALITLSDVLDTVSSTRGSVLYRGASGWAALPPGTTGQVLTMGAADPQWGSSGPPPGVTLVQSFALTFNPTDGQTPNVDWTNPPTNGNLLVLMCWTNSSGGLPSGANGYSVEANGTTLAQTATGLAKYAGASEPQHQAFSSVTTTQWGVVGWEFSGVTGTLATDIVAWTLTSLGAGYPATSGTPTPINTVNNSEVVCFFDGGNATATPITFSTTYGTTDVTSPGTDQDSFFTYVGIMGGHIDVPTSGTAVNPAFSTNNGANHNWGFVEIQG